MVGTAKEAVEVELALVALEVTLDEEEVEAEVEAVDSVVMLARVLVVVEVFGGWGFDVVVLDFSCSTAFAPQLQLPWTMPSPCGAMNLKRPCERSSPFGGHFSHYASSQLV